jgi:hypothetical protein
MGLRRQCPTDTFLISNSLFNNRYVYKYSDMINYKIINDDRNF